MIFILLSRLIAALLSPIQDVDGNSIVNTRGVQLLGANTLSAVWLWHAYMGVLTSICNGYLIVMLGNKKLCLFMDVSSHFKSI
jgi:hypothetical protein